MTPRFTSSAAFASSRCGRFEDAAAPLNAALSTGPGWNWSTLIGLYAADEPYTDQLRGLE